MTAWTPEQSCAIRTVDRSVLVSAAAGSGKTAVLAERCAYLVTDAPHPCRIDELLVVTFTDAAAAEMRERIARALRERQLAWPHDARLRRQLALIDGAQISTIHAFCRNLLNRYFSPANLEPRMPMLDPLEADQLRRQSAKDVFDALSADDAAADRFLDFVSAYGASDRQLQSGVLDLARFLESHDDPAAWIAAARARFDDGDPKQLSPFWLQLLANTVAQKLGLLQSMIADAHQSLPHCDGTDWLLETLPPLADRLDRMVAPLDSPGAPMLSSGGERAPTPPNLAAAIDAIGRSLPDQPDWPTKPRANSIVVKAMSDDDRAHLESAAKHNDSIKKTWRQLAKEIGRFTVADWAAGIAATAPHAGMLLDVVQRVRDRYQEAKRDIGVLDFGDLERHTLDLLRDETHQIAERLDGRYRHVLVDEFQDINPVQAEILRLVSTESVPSRPGNLFAVGDVKQSIYRFRLGEPAIFLERRSRFQKEAAGGELIPLAKNFRSERPVIDAINALFERLLARDLGDIDYDADARLVAHRDRTLKTHEAPCELHVLEEPSSNRRNGDDDESAETEDEAPASADAGPEPADWERIEREAYFIAQRIRALHHDGCPYGEIVILMRSMKARVGLFLRRLLAQDVPAVSTLSGDLFDAIEVLDVLCLLELLDNRQQDISLATVLRSPLIGDALTDSELAAIRTCDAIANRPRPFHEAVRHYTATGPDECLRDRLRAIESRLDDWAALAARRPVADVLWHIYEDTGYLAYVRGLPRGAQRHANLIELHDRARQFGDFRRQGLHRFLKFINELRENDNQLEAGAVAPQGDAVRIMTIHAAKGLEFDTVILAEAGKQFNLNDARGAVLFDRRLGIGLEGVDLKRHFRYPTLPHRIVGDAVLRESLAEELRVLYVALTRAKRRLIVVGTGKSPAGSVSESSLQGPIPLQQRISARSYLAWLTRALEAMPRDQIATAPDAVTDHTLFHMSTVTLDEMKEWSFDEPHRESIAKLSRQAAAFSSIPELTGNAEPDSPVAAIARRLQTPYFAESLTRVPAVVAASELKRRWNALTDEEEPAAPASSLTGLAKYPRAFRTPAFIAGQQSPATTQIGTWTHEFLERIDLAQPCDADHLRAQLDRLVANARFTAERAATIDLDTVAWFFDTPPGRRMRDPATRVLREWPFVLAVDPTRHDANAVAQGVDDVLLVRGIIDCLIRTDAGWEVIDYKTDRVSGDALHTRAREYAGQVQIYAAAVEGAFGDRPGKTTLAFLHARQIVDI